MSEVKKFITQEQAVKFAIDAMTDDEVLCTVAEQRDTLKLRIRQHLANRHAYSLKEFCEKLEEMVFLAPGAAPTQQPVESVQVEREPLTDEQAKQVLKNSELLDMFLHIGWYSAPRRGFYKNGLLLIRAIEAAHGIKQGEPK